ncbi:rod-binding protein [Bartonella ancashensis]|uniref:Flagellar protein FlgJ (Peptidoglycan hydrolase) n=1 Tax=Bartonella ancashensis TaxID=1318743 RepID=A0A0M4L620_9HYPH|nr:rod-binding protein [Bartonella ancashensis]ALE02983.1 Flagellar protein FlgJ (peptidoglycan hydrolase) [Bartonella ancashensis]
MAIQPLSDIVFDVARAADPLEYRASVEKLYSAQNVVRTQGVEQVGERFSELVSSDLLALKGEGHQAPMQSETAKDRESEVFRDFESFMLQSLIENMFTTDSQSFFGKGQTGKIWKSMMVEQLAKEFANSGGIGVAQMLASEKARREESAAHEKEERQPKTAFEDHNTIARAIVYSNDLNLVRQYS